MLVSLALIPLGLAVFYWGIRGRTIGDEVRCRKCYYELTGLEGIERCPECGLPLDPKSIRRGVPRRRPWLIGIGVLLLLPGLAKLPRVISKIDVRDTLYRSLPCYVVIAIAEFNDGIALREIQRRWDNGMLTESNLERLTKVALRKQGMPFDGNTFISWDDVAARLRWTGRFAPSQEDQYIRQVAVPMLRVRSPIRQGDPIVVELSHECRGSTVYEHTLYIMTGELAVDSIPSAGLSRPLLDPWREPLRESPSLISLSRTNVQDISLDRFHWFRWPLPGSGESTRAILALSSNALLPGGHVLDYRGRHLIVRPIDPVMAPAPDPGESVEVKLSAPFEVVPFDSPDPIQMVPDPAVKASLSRHLSVVGSRISLPHFSPPRLQHGHAVFEFNLSEPVHLDLAFEVWLVCDSGEELVGTVDWIHGETGRRVMDGMVDTQTPCQEQLVQIRLRANRTAASYTVGCSKCWLGELTVGQVRVPRRKRFIFDG